MMIHVLHKLPLTTVSVVLFGAYSFGSAVLKQIKHRSAQKILQHSALPKELLNEILNQVIADSTVTSDFTSLSLVCREWNEKISHHDIWLNLMNDKWANFKHKARDLDIHNIFRSTADVLTPKLAYALLSYRIPSINYYARGSVLLGETDYIEFPPDLIPLRSNKNLWVPWLNHTIVQRPETLWKFIYTLIRHPKWIYPLLAYLTPHATHRNYLDPHAIDQLDRLLIYIAILFNFLPWIDNMLIVRLMPAFNQFMNGDSAWYEHFQIWKCSETPVITGLKILTTASSLQAFETSFFNHSMMGIRAIMIAISIIMSCDLFAPLIFVVLMITSIVLHAQSDGIMNRFYWARVWLIIGLIPVIWCAIS